MIHHVCPCGAIATDGRRCVRHQVNRQGFRVERRRDHRHGSREWTEMSARIRADHLERYGPWCPGYGRPKHPSDDLTVDHVRRLTDGGSLLEGEVRVLCRSCNSRANVTEQNAARAGSR